MPLLNKINTNTAIVHDWMAIYSGAEKVLAEISSLFENAHIYTLFDFLNEEERKEISAGHKITVSDLNRLPGVKNYYRYLLLTCTKAIEHFDLREFDLVISSSAALAKGVLTGPHQPHIAYIHTPARYAWDLAPEYLQSLEMRIVGKLQRALAHKMLHRFRIWDQRTGPHVDYYVANSNFIAKRIEKVYRRRAEVIYPPVNTEDFDINTSGRGDYFVVASRLVPYKRIDLIIQAFAERPNLKLHVLGDGPELNNLKKISGSNVHFFGRVNSLELKNQLKNARAFIFAACEDFGIAPVEAQACGTPVIALGKGGTSETVRDPDVCNTHEPTGILFPSQTTDSLLKAIARFISIEAEFDNNQIRANAERFSTEKFRLGFKSYVNFVQSDWK